MKLQRDHIVLLLLSGILFTPFLGHVHLFDWDEINFAESAREMLLTGQWFRVQINFEPFWEKPPLFFWMQALSMQVFGVNEFAARFPNAIAGILTLQLVFFICKKWHDRTTAWTWALLYMGSFLPHLYFRSGIIDPWFNLFIFLSIYFLFLVLDHSDKHRTRNAVLSGAFSGLAILTKGPVGLLLLVLTLLVWLSFRRFRVRFPWKEAGVFAVAAFLVSTLWFGFETIRNGPWFLQEFIAYQIDLLLNPVAGHAQPFYYHFAVVLLGCFPLSVLALPAFARGFEGDDFQFSKWMKYLFWVVMILFSIVTTKIVHYSSMAYLPLSYLAAVVVSRRLRDGRSFSKWQRTWVLVQGSLIALVLVAAPLAIQFKERWIHLIDDPFVQGNLSVPVHIAGWEWTIGVGYAAIVVLGFLWLDQQPKRAIRVLTLGTALTIFCTLLVLVPKIESISQGSAVNFFESHAEEEVHLETYGYKSYAHYFYGKVTPATAHDLDEHALRDAELPVLVSVKANRLERFREAYPTARSLYDAGGFYFFELQTTD